MSTFLTMIVGVKPSVGQCLELRDLAVQQLPLATEVRHETAADPLR